MQNITDQTHETPLALEVVSKAELLQIHRAPEVVLQEAHKAAAALQKVINGKARKVILNGEQYLEFEDWMTLSRFYGVSVKVEWSKPVEFGDVRGFEARAVAFNTGTGQELSAADSMCLSDENNWRNKPLFMLRSMSETRACAKALRQVLAWVVVLAGFKPTPAEEVTELQATRIQEQKAPTQSVHVEHSFSGESATLVVCKTIPYTDKKTNKQKEFYAVTFRDEAGNELEANTFDVKLKDAAEVLTGHKVRISYRPGKRPGKWELIALSPEDTADEILLPD